MFTKQKVFKHVVYKIKSLHTSYVYKTKQNKMFTDKLCLQNKQIFTKPKFNKNVMFTKQNKKFTDKLCLQNKNLLRSYVYKTKLKLKITLCL